MVDMRRLIVTEFDRLYHAATSPVDPDDPTYIPDPPLPGNIKWLAWGVYAPNYRMAVFSWRSCSEDGIQAMQDYLERHGLDRSVIDQIEWPTCKPADAAMFVDARAFRYAGVPPTAADMDNFRPWGSP